MTPLARVIAEDITAHGPMTVCRFMDLALGHPDHGYYRSRDPLGTGGDFITAPEVSQMFGEMIGLWAAVTWQSLGQPAPVLLVELGPGRGTLMADALRAARIVPDFHAALDLHLVETSPALRARQAEALAAAKPVFHNDFDDLPPGPAIVIANEFLDALPVRQFVMGPEGWCERCVDAAPGDEAGFMFTGGEALAETACPAGLPSDAPPGAIAEICPAARSLAHGLGARFAAQPGAALIVDYGHAAGADGVVPLGDTLQAVRHHAYADPLAAPGEADLTAHVDFAALAEAARKGGAEVFGPVDQADFLLALGIAARAEQLMQTATPAQRADLDAGLARLLAPGEMGKLFKVLALAAPGTPRPPGFGAEGGALSTPP